MNGCQKKKLSTDSLEKLQSLDGDLLGSEDLGDVKEEEEDEPEEEEVKEEGPIESLEEPEDEEYKPCSTHSQDTKFIHEKKRQIEVEEKDMEQPRGVQLND